MVLWRGRSGAARITFGLITIPIKLFTAVRSNGVSFNQLDDRTMGRIRYLKVSEDSGEEVPAEHIVKGVEISKGRYVIVAPDELAPFVPLATKTIDVEEFVDLAEIDPLFFESSYYVASAPAPRSPTPCSPQRWSRPARWRSSGSSCAAASTPAPSGPTTAASCCQRWPTPMRSSPSPRSRSWPGWRRSRCRTVR